MPKNTMAGYLNKILKHSPKGGKTDERGRGRHAQQSESLSPPSTSPGFFGRIRERSRGRHHSQDPDPDPTVDDLDQAHIIPPQRLNVIEVDSPHDGTASVPHSSSGNFSADACAVSLTQMSTNAPSVVEPVHATTGEYSTAIDGHVNKVAKSSSNCDNGVENTCSPSKPSPLWERTLHLAEQKLLKYKLPALQLDHLDIQGKSTEEIIREVIENLENAQKDIESKRWSYRDRNGNDIVIVERLGNILKSVNKYAMIVDTAIQHSPEITALVWAGMRGIIQVCEEF